MKRQQNKSMKTSDAAHSIFNKNSRFHCAQCMQHNQKHVRTVHTKAEDTVLPS